MLPLIKLLFPAVQFPFYLAAHLPWVLMLQLDGIVMHVLLIYALAQTLILGRR